MGNALVARLFYSLRQNEVPILFGSPLIDLVFEDNHVKGAILESEDGRKYILARKHLGLVNNIMQSFNIYDNDDDQDDDW